MNAQYTEGKYAKAFTSIDLLISLVVLAILTCLAYPAYTAHLRKGHRMQAKAILMETAQYMERYYATHNTYVGARVEAVSNVSPKHSGRTQARYRIAFASTPTASTFMLQALPVNAQKADPCGILSINELGAKQAASEACW